MTQELRKLAEAVRDAKTHNELVLAQTKLDDSLTSRQLLELLDRLEKAEKDAARLDYMQQGVTVELLYYGPNRNFRIGGRFLAIDSDIRTAIDAAMEASK